MQSSLVEIPPHRNILHTVFCPQTLLMRRLLRHSEKVRSKTSLQAYCGNPRCLFLPPFVNCRAVINQSDHLFLVMSPLYTQYAGNVDPAMAFATMSSFELPTPRTIPGLNETIELTRTKNQRAQAVMNFEVRADDGDPLAMRFLVNHYLEEEHIGVPRNLKKAVKYLDLLLNREPRNNIAWSQRGVLYFHQNQFSKALHCFNEVDGSLLPEAEICLGQMYEQGLCVIQSFAVAQQCYARAAQQGHPGAATKFAHVHKKAELEAAVHKPSQDMLSKLEKITFRMMRRSDVEQTTAIDPEQARVWCQQVATTEAKTTDNAKHLTSGGHQNQQPAEENCMATLEKSARSGDTSAMLALGEMYQTDPMVKDLQKAFDYIEAFLGADTSRNNLSIYRKAQSICSELAYELGVNYFNGTHSSDKLAKAPHYAVALYYFEEATRLKHHTNTEKIDEMIKLVYQKLGEHCQHKIELENAKNRTESSFFGFGKSERNATPAAPPQRDEFYSHDHSSAKRRETKIKEFFGNVSDYQSQVAPTTENFSADTGATENTAITQVLISSTSELYDDSQIAVFFEQL